MGIFSENRREWFITELAACSDSIVTVPIAVEQQFLDDTRISFIVDKTEMQTLCVSQQTIGLILDLKSKDKMSNLKNLILFDSLTEVQTTLANQAGLTLYSFEELLDEGHKVLDVEKEEPKQDSIFYLGITSGTTG